MATMQLDSEMFLEAFSFSPCHFIVVRTGPYRATIRYHFRWAYLHATCDNSDSRANRRRRQYIHQNNITFLLGRGTGVPSRPADAGVSSRPVEYRVSADNRLFRLLTRTAP